MTAQRGLILPPSGYERFRWHVEIEKYAGVHGNLDIIIFCREIGYLLVVENKIGAGEQKDQLRRYARWLKSQSDNFATRQLVFLTPTGREAVTAADESYICLSYHRDIRAWLVSSAEQTDAPPVKEVLRQYIQVIQDC